MDELKTAWKVLPEESREKVLQLAVCLLTKEDKAFLKDDEKAKVKATKRRLKRKLASSDDLDTRGRKIGKRKKYATETARKEAIRESNRKAQARRREKYKELVAAQK